MTDLHNFRRKLSTPEAANYCGSGTGTFEKLRLSGGGPAYIKIGRRVAYDPSDLDAWCNARKRSSTTQAIADEPADNRDQRAVRPEANRRKAA